MHQIEMIEMTVANTVAQSTPRQCLSYGKNRTDSER